MNRLFITSIVLLAMTFSQEIDSSLVDNKQVLNTSIQNPDSLIVDTLAIPLDIPLATPVPVINENGILKAPALIVKSLKGIGVNPAVKLL